jgi:TonB-dependent starch-binding outer membrane protein SusC
MRKFYGLSKMIRQALKNRMNLYSLIFTIAMFSSGLVLAQDNKVSGRVVSMDDGEPLPGVTVLEVGTSNGTVTDIDGNYSMNVSKGAVLTYSFIGFKVMSIPVNSRSVIDAKLEVDISELDEVVVVGYGEMRRADITSAQTSVGAAQISKTVNTTIEQAIQGRAAGVYVTQNSGQPGGGISINIRGVSTIGGSTEPLYVIDGIQIAPGSVEFGSQSSTNPLSGINPADIESIEVLQGPSATAVYGSRAANGVLLVTTKRGKAGAVKISYGTQMSLQTAPKNLDVLNLRQYAQMNKEFHEIAGGETPEEFMDPSLLGEGTDWQKALFSNSAMYKHQLSVSGGSENTTYYLSGEYLNQDGVSIGSGFERYGVRLNLDTKPKKWIAFGTNLAFNQRNENLTSSQENTIANALQLTPQIPVKNIDGTWGGPSITNGANQFSPVNPVALAQLTTNDLNRKQLLAGVNLKLNLLEGLTIQGSFDTNVEFTNSTYFVPQYRWGYNENPVASLTNRANNSSYWRMNQLIQYNKTIGDHSFGVMLSHEAQESVWKNLSGSRRDFVVNDILDLNIGDLSTSVAEGGQGQWAMESYISRVNYNFKDKYILNASIRRDGSVNFGPDNKWGVFPAASVAWRLSEESFYNLPVLNDVKFRYETGLSGNQGSVAGIYSPLQSAITPWGTGFSPSKYGNPALQWESTLTNNYGINLGLFENRIQMEFDYYVKSTDNLIVDIPLPYYMGVNGQGAAAPPVVNIGSLQTKGWGFTLNTTNINRNGFKWESNFNVSSFKSKVTKLSTASAQIDRISWWMNDWTQRTVVGKSPWLFMGYVEEGIFQSVEEIENSALPVDNNGVELPINEANIWVGDVKFKDISGPDGKPDGIIDTHDRTFIGNPWPKLFAGFTNNFSYKGIELSVLLTSTYGNDIYNQIARVNSNPNQINLSRNLMVEALNYARVTPEGTLENPGTTVARITTSSANGNYVRHTSKWVEDGSFIRVKNINLNYNIPTKWLQSTKVIQSARIGFSAQNVWTFTKYSGYDPEVGAYVGRDTQASNQAIGLDYGRYPLTPVYTINLGIDF